MNGFSQSRMNVSQFLNQYESHETRKSYNQGLKQFFKCMYPNSQETLDTLSIKYLQESRDYRNDLLKFKDTLVDKAPLTRTARINSIRVYLDDNGISIPKRLQKHLNGKVNEAISYEKVPSNEELKRIIEYLPLQGKVLALVLSSSGMRIGEAVKLKIKDVDLTREIPKIRILAQITKTGKRRICFISPEAKEVVEEWLRYRDQYLVQARGRSAKHKRNEKDLGFLFPFHTGTFNFMWKNALRKAQLDEVDSKTGRLFMRPHNLRKFFRLRVGRYGRDEAEALMGHHAGLNRIYANFDDAEERLEETYKKAIEELSIYKREIQVVQLDEEMKNTIRELEDQVNALVTNGLAKDAKITYLTVNDEKKTKEIVQLKQKMKKKTEEDEELKRRIANNELDIQSWNTLKPYLEEILNSTGLTWKSQDITSKNRKVTTED